MLNLWGSRLELRQLHTSLDWCVGVWPGKVHRAGIEELQRQRFDCHLRGWPLNSEPIAV